LPDTARRVPSRAFIDTSDTTLASVEAAAREAARQPGSTNGFHLLADGLDAFVARATLARLAERSLDVQYYLYHDDFIGGLLTHAVLEAADRGVRVRILLDDMDFGGRDRGLALVDAPSTGRDPNLQRRQVGHAGVRDAGPCQQDVGQLGERGQRRQACVAHLGPFQAEDLEVGQRRQGARTGIADRGPIQGASPFARTPLPVPVPEVRRRANLPLLEPRSLAAHGMELHGPHAAGGKGHADPAPVVIRDPVARRRPLIVPGDLG
jgi:hypothetical protein